MSVQTRKKAELFYKALEDVWVAERTWRGSPNNAVWHCTQAAEKIMKGYLRCFNKEYGYDHDLEKLSDEVNDLIELPDDVNKYIIYLNGFLGRLRYKNMPADPTAEDAKIAISRAKRIMDEFSKIPDISGYMAEAKEVHSKILKSMAEEDS